ncbi:MAG: ribosome biogenesis GTPase YqeH [Candidatus Izemoplasma sp.]
MDDLQCIGCGSTIQSNDKLKAGFIPESKLSGDDLGDVVCQRCFRLKNYNEILPSNINSDEYLNIISEIGKSDALIVKIIDIFDIEGTLIPQIAKLTNHNDLLILANKVDLIPKSLKESKLIHHLRKIIADSDLKPLDIKLMSATKNRNIDSIIDTIISYSRGRDVYVVGATNVGKSTFINTLLRLYANTTKDVITVSNLSGTTLNLIKIPFGKGKIIDTPGLINKNQITHYLTQKSVNIITPKKEIKPKGFQLNSEQTLFIGGLARIDFVSGEKSNFICYFSERLNIHRTKLSNADNLYDTQQFKLLSPPTIDDDEFIFAKHNFKLNGNIKQDIILPGLGFVSVKGKVDITVHYKKGLVPYIRDTII